MENFMEVIIACLWFETLTFLSCRNQGCDQKVTIANVPLVQGVVITKGNPIIIIL